MPLLESYSWNSTSAYRVLANASSDVPSTRSKPLTPLIAGSVCGGVMGIAWIIGFSIYFVKRYKRKRLNRQIAAGKALPKQTANVDEKIIIPPDPAVLGVGGTLGKSGAINGHSPQAHVESPRISKGKSRNSTAIGPSLYNKDS